MKLYGGALALYIFDNLVNHYNIATEGINSKKLNLKDGGNNTPILRYLFYIDQNGHIVVHIMQITDLFQKGLKTILF